MTDGIKIISGGMIEKGGFGSIISCSINGNPNHVFKKVEANVNILEPAIMASIIHPNIKSSIQTCFIDEVLHIFQTRESHDLSYPTTKDPNEIKNMLFGIVDGIASLHKFGICHGDLKSTNILITNGQVKLTDFGLSSMKKSSKRSKCTYNYRPMELLDGSKSHGLSVDIWALGCVMWEIATGEMLFPVQEIVHGDTTNNRKRHINAIMDYDNWIKGIKKNTSDSYVHPNFNVQISTEILELIKYVLVVDQHYRPTIYDIAKHPYFTGYKLTEPRIRQNIPRSIDEKEMKRLKHFHKNINPKTFFLYESVANWYIDNEKELLVQCEKLANCVYEDEMFDPSLIQLVSHLGFLLLHGT